MKLSHFNFDDEVLLISCGAVDPGVELSCFLRFVSMSTI